MVREAIALIMALGISTAVLAGGNETASTTGDHSLTVAEYQARGMPPLDRVWRAAEYQKALEVLRALPVAQLPRISNPRSSPILEKLLDPANYQACIDDTLPLMNDLQSCKGEDVCMPIVMHLRDVSNVCVAQLESLRQIGNDVYASGFAKEPRLVDDFVVFVGMIIQLAGKAVDFNRAIADALDRIAPGNPQSAELRGQQRDKVSQLIELGSKMMVFTDEVSPWARLRYAKGFTMVYPKLVPYATVEARQRAEALLKPVAERDANPEVRKLVADALTAAAAIH